MCRAIQGIPTKLRLHFKVKCSTLGEVHANGFSYRIMVCGAFLIKFYKKIEFDALGTPILIKLEKKSIKIALELDQIRRSVQ